MWLYSIKETARDLAPYFAIFKVEDGHVQLLSYNDLL